MAELEHYKSCQDGSCWKDPDYMPPAETKTCNKGDLQCCNSVQSAKSVDFSKVVTSDIYQLIPNAMQGSL